MIVEIYSTFSSVIKMFILEPVVRHYVPPSLDKDCAALVFIVQSTRVCD